MIREDIRNIAIIAHVDHGKTTLVDALLKQSGLFRDSQLQETCILDSNELERERGITILAKNIAITYQGIRINVIDTPGHADFGGEVERTLQMADGCLLLVDAFDGPMPQTRFVLRKAFEAGLKPIVVVNKVDRPEARPKEVLNLVYDLFIDLGASDEQIDFPYVFCSGKQGWASHDADVRGENIRPVFDMIVSKVSGPKVDPEGPFQMRVTTLDYSKYVGRIAIGRITRGAINKGERVTLIGEEKTITGTATQLLVFDKLGRVETDKAIAGDIVAVVGFEESEIGDTLAHVDHPESLPRLTVDLPTLSMLFTINDSPMAGRDGQFLTSRNLRERLMRELERNVALRVEETSSKDEFVVSGRGLLHLGILIETMRREGYELSVGKPIVIMKEISGEKCEPIEELVIDVPTERVGPAMELCGARKGIMVNMEPVGTRTQLKFTIPARGLIGLKNRLLNATKGEAIMHHVFHEYAPLRGDIPTRIQGVLISNSTGKAVAYALDSLQDRGTMFVKPGDEVYPGMVIGEHCRENDLVVNPIKEKKLTNIRAASADDNIILAPPRDLSLELALEYIEDDEMVEITPKFIRLRKKILTEEGRKRAGRSREAVG
jgi:GTP-binding protein